MAFDLKDYQNDIDDVARQFVDILERAIVRVGNDPVELQAAGQTIVAAIGKALDAEQVKRCGGMETP